MKMENVLVTVPTTHRVLCKVLKRHEHIFLCETDQNFFNIQIELWKKNILVEWDKFDISYITSYSKFFIIRIRASWIRIRIR